MTTHETLIMIEIKRILCPVDFSEFSQRAVDHAAALAHWYEARLTVLYVIPTVSSLGLSPEVTAADRERLMGDLKCLTAHVPSHVKLELRLREAQDIHTEILYHVAQTHADLLVLGSHGRSGFERFMLGSETERLMRKAPCPTLVVPRRASDAEPERPVQVHRILCSVDFSDGSRQALEYAIALAEEADAQLTLLHVIEVPPELHENPLSEGFDVDRIRAAAKADGLRRLSELVPEGARPYCTVETTLREGEAYREILQEADDGRADLIVMGVQGRGAIDLLVFGSNTARVARGATCPVLIVPRKMKDV